MKRSFWIAILIFIGLLAIPIAFYWEKVSTIYTDPKHFFSVLFDAGGFLNITWKVFLINLGLAGSLLLIEMIMVGWKQSAIKRLFNLRDRSVMGDVMCWLLSIFGLYDFFVLLSTLGIFYLLNGIIQSKLYLGFGESIGNPYLLFAIVFVLSDFKAYLWHLLMHKIRPFWEVHQYHHSATSFNLLTTSRGHFLGKAIQTVLDAFLFALVGAPPQVLVGLYLIKEVWGMWIHSGAQFNMGALRYVLITPRMHKVHHSTDHKHFDKNFGTFFAFWDLLLGTYAAPEEVKDIGVENDPYNRRGFWYDMILGFKLFIKAFIPKSLREADR